MSKPFWSGIQSFFTGIAAVTLSAFMLITYLLQPLWVEINGFLGLGFDVITPILLITFLALIWTIWLLLWEIIWKSPFTSIWSLLSSLLTTIVWALTTYILLSQAATSIPSIIKLSQFNLYLVVFFLVTTAIFTIAFKRLKSKPSLALAVCCLVAVGYTGSQAVRNYNVEQNRWAKVSLLDHSDWHASWITAPTELFQKEFPQNSWWNFRKDFSLTTVPAKALARIATDTYYWLWINGELVVREGGLKRGPTPYDTYFDTVDLAPYLVTGNNTVAVLVWHFGRDGFSHVNSGKAGLIFDLQSPGFTLLSDSTWSVIQNPAFFDTVDPNPNYRLAESNIGFNAANEIQEWVQPVFDASKWSKAVDAGQPPVSPWYNLVARPIPQWQDSDLVEYDSIVTETLKFGDQEIRAKLPYNMQFYPYLQVKAEAGLTIAIRTDAYQNGGANSVRAEYITRAGEQEFESPGWMNGEQVVYSLPEGVELISVKYRQTGYAASQTGSFIGDDIFFNDLYKKSYTSLTVNMRDTFSDSPNRERAQWWGDEMIELQEAGYALDPDGLLLARKGILELAAWQKADGSLFSPIPAGNWAQELPVQMLEAVYGIRQYYYLTGDLDTVKTVYPAIRKYMALWQTDATGLVIHRTGGWDFMDAGENIDQPVLENAWYYLALKSQAELARAAGETDDLEEITRKMKQLAGQFNASFRTADGYRSAEYTEKTDDRAQAMAVVAGLAQPEDYPTILKVLQQEFHASPAMENFVFQALMQMGYDQAALDRLEQRYKPQVDSEHTTLWESWELDNESTYNHAWGGGSLYLLPGYVAGVRPMEPGYAVFEVVPQMADLGRVGASIPTPHGIIEVHLRRSADQYGIQMTVPAGTYGWVKIKEADYGLYQSIQITHTGKTIPSSRYITDGRYVYYQVVEGAWEFTFAR